MNWKGLILRTFSQQFIFSLLFVIISHQIDSNPINMRLLYFNPAFLVNWGLDCTRMGI